MSHFANIYSLPPGIKEFLGEHPRQRLKMRHSIDFCSLKPVDSLSVKAANLQKLSPIAFWNHYFFSISHSNARHLSIQLVRFLP